MNLLTRESISTLPRQLWATATEEEKRVAEPRTGASMAEARGQGGESRQLYLNK